MTGNCEASSLKWCLCQNLGYLAFYNKSKGDFRSQAPSARAEIPRTNLSDSRCRQQRLWRGHVKGWNMVEQLTSGVFWNDFQSACSDVLWRFNDNRTQKKGILSDALVSLMFCCASVSAPWNPISSSVLPAVETSNHYKDSRNHHLHLQKARLLNLEMPELGGKVAKWPFIMDKRKCEWNQSLTNGREWWQILKLRG